MREAMCFCYREVGFAAVGPHVSAATVEFTGTVRWRIRCSANAAVGASTSSWPSFTVAACTCVPYGQVLASGILASRVTGQQKGTNKQAAQVAVRDLAKLYRDDEPLWPLATHQQIAKVRAALDQGLMPLHMETMDWAGLSQAMLELVSIQKA